MNRSFQSVAALLVSLSGAMLAVTWVPLEGPRPTPEKADRKRAVAVPCGYAMLRAADPALVDAIDPGFYDQPPVAGLDCGPPSEPPMLNAAWVQPALETASQMGQALFDAPALRAMASALGPCVRPLWPLADDSQPARASAEDAERRRIEDEYAAAELAASRPAVEPLVGRAMEQGVAGLVDGLKVLSGRPWALYGGKIKQQFINNYEYISNELECHDLLQRLQNHALRQHQRLALREALLTEMDRHFLDSLRVPAVLPQQPETQPGNNGGLLILAANALETLSQALGEAADQLKAASRHDVAELHTPVENREEKR